ncbi:MFS transporter [Pseudarthrobacter sp. SSS035]|uniref:MFS transporter n=1 Tax=Pseudarthrobacter sp. SSS035 TaxID=2931399 RepID=UPI0020102F00|nr:MFS transporter [Pseudarthrobacter sp. SSS035]
MSKTLPSNANLTAGQAKPAGSAKPGKDPLRKVVIAAAAGNALEWFDFSSYAFFASYISVNFFMQGDSSSGLIATFLVFAVGFLARPLGAIVLGSYGDTHGRKATLTLTVSLMAVGTFIIGFAPPFWAIGIGAPILLLVGRLFQGFSAGGEIGGATAYLVEKAPVERRAGLTGWLQGSMGLANAMSALIGVVITSTFSQSELTEWAWRIPFFIGLLIVPVAVYIRKQLDETEEFLSMKESMGAEKRSPIRELFRHYPKQLVVAALMAILWTVSVYALVIYAPTYYSSKTVGLGFTPNEAFWASLVGNLFMMFACVYAGRLADRFGTERTLRWMTWVLIAVPVPALVVLHAVPTLPVLIVVHIVLCIAVSGFAGIIPSALARVFPAKVRSTGTSFSYNIAAIFFAGFTPALMTWAVQITSFATGIYVVFAGLVALATLPAFLRLIAKQEAESAVATG